MVEQEEQVQKDEKSYADTIAELKQDFANQMKEMKEQNKKELAERDKIIKDLMTNSYSAKEQEEPEKTDEELAVERVINNINKRRK